MANKKTPTKPKKKRNTDRLAKAQPKGKGAKPSPEKKERGQPAHRPTKERREQVQLYACAGVPQERIALILDISVKTLRKYYREELDISLDKANAEIAGKLFKKAQNGCFKSQKFWLQTRARWSTRVEVENTGAVATMDVTPTDKPFATVEEGAKAYKELMESLQG